MAKNLIPEDLQALITQYLTDGVLTAKEREVILKKAEAMGLDRDEVDLYLDAEVQKIDQATDAAVRKQKGRQCPFCGANIPVLTDKCPECGGNITPEADKELEEILENLEEALVDLKSGKDFEKSKATVERYARKAELYYSSNPKIQKLLTEVREEMVLAGKNARKKTFVNLAKKYRWILLILMLAIIGLIWSAKPDPANNPQDCINAVVSALNNGDIDKAVGFCATFKNNHPLDADDIAAAYTAITKAYIEKGDYDKAINMVQGVYNLEELESDLRKEICDRCIAVGEYDKAENYANFEYDGYARYYDYMCKCIDHMKANGKKDMIKQFIDRKIETPDPGYGHWNRSIHPAKIYQYAGLNVSNSTDATEDEDYLEEDDTDVSEDLKKAQEAAEKLMGI